VDTGSLSRVKGFGSLEAVSDTVAERGDAMGTLVSVDFGGASEAEQPFANNTPAPIATESGKRNNGHLLLEKSVIQQIEQSSRAKHGFDAR